MKPLLFLLVSPLLAHAGVVYDITFRHIDQANFGAPSADASPEAAVVTRYFVNDGRVRIGGPSAKTVYVFDGPSMTVIDNAARSAHVLEHATLTQVAAHYADAVKQLENAAAAAAPDERAAAEEKAADMRAASERLLQRVTRDYRLTSRFESADGRACRVWEEREQGAKRMELCIAPAASVPGGAQILSGMQTLSRFRQGADFAFGVELGLSGWWSDFAMLGGVPLLVREYRYDGVVAEVLLSGMHETPVSPALFAVPDGYAVAKGPDYTVWYVR